MCMTTSWSSDVDDAIQTNQDDHVANVLDNEQVEDSIHTPSDIELEVSTGDSLTSLTSTSPLAVESANKLISRENDASSGSLTGTPQSGDELSGNDACMDSDLNGNDNNTNEINKNSAGDGENDRSIVKHFTNLNKLIR